MPASSASPVSCQPWVWALCELPSLHSLQGGPCIQLALSMGACALTRRHMRTWMASHRTTLTDRASEAVLIRRQCFSYLLLHNKPPPHLVVWNNILIILVTLWLGQQWKWLVPALQ